MSDLNHTNVNPQVVSQQRPPQSQQTQPGRIDQNHTVGDPSGPALLQSATKAPGRNETQSANEGEVPLHLILSGRTGAATSSAPSTVQSAAGVVQVNGQGQIVTEEEYLNSLHKDNPAGPLMVAGILCAAALFAQFVVGSLSAGIAGGFLVAIIGAVGLAFSIGVCFVVAKTVAGIFGEDYGSPIELFGKVAATCGGYEIVFVGLTVFVNPLFAAIFAFPALVLLALFLIGMEAFQAFVFALASTALKFLLILLIVGTLFNAAMSNAGM